MRLHAKDIITPSATVKTAAPNSFDVPNIVGITPKQITVKAAGVDLNVYIWGDESKPPLLMLHGGRDHARNWDWTVKELVKDRCCIVPDLRGHGDSGWASPFGYENTYILDMHYLLADLEARGFEMPIDIVGHSMGGGIAISMAAIFNDKIKSVVAMEGLGTSQNFYDAHMEKPRHERLRFNVQKMISRMETGHRIYDNIDAMLQRMISEHQNLSEEQATYLALHGIREVPYDGEGAGTDGYVYHWKFDPALFMFPPAALTHPDEYKTLHEGIECPALLTIGSTSWASNPIKDGRIKSFKNAECVEYDGAGHWHHHDQTEKWITDLKGFLKL